MDLCTLMSAGFLTRCCRLMEGGADSGFRHVEPEKYQSRLFHFCGEGKNVVMSQVIHEQLLWSHLSNMSCRVMS